MSLLIDAATMLDIIESVSIFCMTQILTNFAMRWSSYQASKEDPEGLLLFKAVCPSLPSKIGGETAYQDV